jgi:hypothetical protein
MLSMPAAPLHRTAAGAPMVLVAYVNVAVGNALAQRLMESCLVALATAEAAEATLRRRAGFDVVVLCPYLTPGERAGLLDACGRQKPAPAVLELSDEPGALRPHVRTVSVPAALRSPAEHVLSSLSPSA